MILRALGGATRRAWNVESRAHVHLSHIGSKPIDVPPTVKLVPSPTAISIEGPLGTTSIPLFPFVKIDLQDPKTMLVSVEDAEVKVQRQMWGTTRTMIFNAITGMTEGFTIPLFLVGVGYRVALEDDPRGTSDGGTGQRLNMKLGYSHSIFVPVPPHIKVEVPLPTKITLFCTDKHQIGLFAAKLRQFRKPEPYKGKGIFIGNEQVRIKAVKKK
ncbi:ribosomal protein L6, alpha-beta domain-containing protein [Mycena rebaudengoi]|nr:ribosomal protein L6, alpha-beta domain-containing protein [Mycena rebaudengoi]